MGHGIPRVRCTRGEVVLRLILLVFLNYSQLVLKHGGRFALSDDSHGPHAVGLNYRRLAEYLRAAGVFELWYLQKSDNRNAAGRCMRPVRVTGSWSDATFWLSNGSS